MISEMKGNKLKKILIKALLICASIIITLSGISQGLMNMQFRQSDKKIRTYFTSSPVQPNIYFAECEDRLVRVVEVFNHDSLPNLIFVHGAPGSSNDFIRYLADPDLQSHFNLITYDRPGYGYSGFGHSMISIKEQAAIIDQITGHLSGKSILIGHSYGGPIILQFAFDYPDRYSTLVLLAPANDPDNELIFKIAYLGKWPPTRWLTPTAMRVAADEKFSHAKELGKMIPYYPTIDKKVIHVHGTKDSLVPFVNLEFTEEHLNNADFEKVVLENEDHFIPWTKFDLIKIRLLNLSQ